jgi:hypothetical protein
MSLHFIYKCSHLWQDIPHSSVPRRNGVINVETIQKAPDREIRFVSWYGALRVRQTTCPLGQYYCKMLRKEAEPKDNSYAIKYRNFHVYRSKWIYRIGSYRGNFMEQWSPTWGTCSLGCIRRHCRCIRKHFTWYVKLKEIL